MVLLYNRLFVKSLEAQGSSMTCGLPDVPMLIGDGGLTLLHVTELMEGSELKHVFGYC